MILIVWRPLLPAPKWKMLMFTRNLAIWVLASFFALSSAAFADAKPKKDSKPSLNDISMEVAVLQTVHQFQLTVPQLEKLKALAKETAAKSRRRDAPKASKEFRDKLEALHRALVEGDDFDALQDDVDELREQEKPVLDDDVEITPAARRKTPEVLKQIKANQLANFLSENSDEIVDPTDTLTRHFEDMRDWKNGEVKERSEELADQIAVLVAGIDATKSKKVHDGVITLIKQVRAVEELDLPEELPKLEKAAQKIVGAMSPVDVLRNFVEYNLAELLSNPRLEPALRARLKHLK
jgi:hypothetical protein